MPQIQEYLDIFENQYDLNAEIFENYHDFNADTFYQTYQVCFWLGPVVPTHPGSSNEKLSRFDLTIAECNGSENILIETFPKSTTSSKSNDETNDIMWELYYILK